MLTTTQIAQHLDRITYKPGWRFAVYDGRWEGQHLAITTVVPDAFTPGRSITLDVHCFLPPMRDTDALEEWLMWRLGRVETHEMREFFKRDGKVVNSPHKPYADRDED